MNFCLFGKLRSTFLFSCCQSWVFQQQPCALPAHSNHLSDQPFVTNNYCWNARSPYKASSKRNIDLFIGSADSAGENKGCRCKGQGHLTQMKLLWLQKEICAADGVIQSCSGAAAASLSVAKHSRQWPESLQNKSCFLLLLVWGRCSRN